MGINVYSNTVDRVAMIDLNKSSVDAGNIVLTAGPINLLAGDVLNATFTHEITSELPFIIGIGRSFILNQDMNSVLGTYLLPSHMTNMNNVMHHMSVQATAFQQIAQNIPNAYIHAVIYGVSSHGNGQIKVEPGYGKLSVQVMRQ